jgi:NAD+ kinase
VGVQRLGFAFNPTDPGTQQLREQATAWCAAQGLDSWAAPAGDYDGLIRELPTSDVLVVLGGDGTFLRAAQAVAAVDVPILGINAGKVGFLSKTTTDQLDSVLGLLAEGAFGLEDRMTLEVRVLRGARDASAEPHVALNEAAVVRGSLARVLRLEVVIDDTHLATFIADGLVVSSPTGSTGYSFSAGGPILDPTSRNLVVTPIAAYLTALRSVVVAPRHTVTVRVVAAHDVQVSIDGREDIPVAVGDSVQVRARERPIRFVEPHGQIPFWELLRQKAELLPP